MTQPPRIAVFGATSAIAEAVARRYAATGASFFLVGRRAEALDRLAADLEVRGAAGVAVAAADLGDLETHAALLEAAEAVLGLPDIVLVAWGTLTEQARAEADPAYAAAELTTNFTAPAALLLRIARWLEPQGPGVIAVISSVAGDRGRGSNFVYGAAKGGLQRFLEGLRHRLHRSRIAVLDIRPGFVATPMTAHLPQSGPLWATPEQVADDILRGIERHRAVIYTRWFWRWIMLVVRNLPRSLFHRSKL
jgi:short-subunit dehydrogenase